MANKTLTINGVNFSLLTGKKAEDLARDYRYAERNGRTQLWHVYDRCSRRKEWAFEECDKIRQEVGGYTMYIGGFNTCTFTLLYLLRYDGKEYVVKETHCNRYIAEVNFGCFR